MSNLVSESAAKELALAFGDFCKIRVLEERSKQESIQALAVIDCLMRVQRESGVVMVEQKKLDKFAAIMLAEST